MFCPKCGKEIETGSTVCTYCGAEIRPSSQTASNDTGEAKQLFFDSDIDVKESEIPSDSTPREKVEKICGNPLTLILACAISFSTVMYIIMMAMGGGFSANLNFYWLLADTIVPIVIFAFLSIGCWVIYLHGVHQKQIKGAFTWIGAALIIEIFHWILVWAMSGITFVGSIISVSWMGGVYDYGYGVLGWVTRDGTIVLFIFAFFCIIALGVQMIVSIRRHANVPAKKIMQGKDAVWRPSRLSIALPIILAALSVTMCDWAWRVMFLYDKNLYMIPDYIYNEFPYTIMMIFLIVYAVANLIALIIMIRIRRKNRPQKVKA